jgi:hypothetical protein
MEYCNVVLIKEGVVDECVLILGTSREEVAAKAEETFFNRCSTRLSNWDDYDSEDREAIIEQGYEEWGTGSICITWPDDIPLETPEPGLPLQIMDNHDRESTGIIGIDSLHPSKVRNILAAIFRCLYIEEDGSVNPDKDLSGADFIAIVTDLMPRPNCKTTVG